MADHGPLPGSSPTFVRTRPAAESQATPRQYARNMWLLRDDEGFGVDGATTFRTATAAKTWLKEQKANG